MTSFFFAFALAYIAIVTVRSRLNPVFTRLF
jgi:hypothetical protein